MEGTRTAQLSHKVLWSVGIQQPCLQVFFTEITYLGVKRSVGCVHLSGSVTAKYIVILHWVSLRVGCIDFGPKWSLVTILLAFSGSCAFLGEPNKHFPAINGIFLEDHITPPQLSAFVSWPKTKVHHHTVL